MMMIVMMIGRRYPWGLLKAVLVCKLDIVVSEYRRQNDTMEIDGETFETRYDRVVKCLQTLERYVRTYVRTNEQKRTKAPSVATRTFNHAHSCKLVVPFS